MSNANEAASAALLSALKATGFEACEEGGTCEKCGDKNATLYFGNRNYWDCREGDYWCGACVIALNDTNERDYAAAMESLDNAHALAEERSDDSQQRVVGSCDSEVTHV